MPVRYGKKYSYDRDGLTSATAAESAWAIKQFNPTAGDGLYWINLPIVGPTRTWCLMSDLWDGGGWMLSMIAASTGSTWNYDSIYWTNINTLNPVSSLRGTNGDVKNDFFNYFPALDILALWPDINIGSGGSIPGTGQWTWLDRGFNNNERIALTPFFRDTVGTPMTWGGSGLFRCDAKTFSGWAPGVFSSQRDIRFYGFNYQNNPYYGLRARVRWGFGWNENSEGLFPSTYVVPIGSNDVSGGIGMDTGFGSFSAGDRVNCCNDTGGINRQARVEIYVR